MMERHFDEMGSEFERELGALLGSVNFSGYRDRARLRSDDLVVRALVSGDLLDAKARIVALISQWWTLRAGEPTRERPFPQAALSAKLRVLRAYAERLARLESEVRGAVAPDVDRVWSARNDGSAVLQSLISFDRALVREARALTEATRTLAVSDLDGDDPFAPLTLRVVSLESILRERAASLRAV